MPYEKNLTKKKFLQINKKQLTTIPNIIGNHFKHISNQQMLTGIILEASDPISKNPDFWSILEFENRTFDLSQLFSKINWWPKLFAILSGHERRPFKQKRASLQLLRKSKNNSASALLPPKCSRKISKIHAYALSIKHIQKKVASNKQKTSTNHSQHQREPFQTHFQSTNVDRDRSRGLWPNFGKSRFWSILEFENRTFEFR